MKVGFISLGCSKNLVDTEMAIGLFKNNNYEIVNNPKEAEIIVINTCGFIESAKQEAIDTILEMAEYKKQKCKYLIAMGCMVQRYKDDLEKALPEVDLWIKYDSYDTFWSQIENFMQGKAKEDKTKRTVKMNTKMQSEKNDITGQLIQEKGITNQLEQNENIACQLAHTESKKMHFLDRVISTGDNFAYLRIAEGCSNRCTYCAIPYIRGPFVSRTIEDIIEEANKLVDEGYSELILIAQDTTKYGIDIYGEPKLAQLLEKLCKIDKVKWIRFLYAYPETITDELIKVVKENDKICKYFDIPIQHISDSVLKRMNRKSNGESIRKLIQKLRKEIPEVVIRTTVMVGFPGETKEDFEELYEFIKWAKFDKLGAFTYSKEDGTPAEKLKEQVHHNTKKSRYNKIMELQQEISRENLKRFIGKELEVLVEAMTFDGKYYVARSYMDVPDIDGFVYIKVKDKSENLVGKYTTCKIVDVKEYDLIGE